jgi:hypothetical protein
LRLPFRIFTVQNDGHLHFVEALPTLDEAKTRVRELGEAWPGEYVIAFWHDSAMPRIW